MDVKASCPNSIISLSEAGTIYEMDKENYEESTLRGMFLKEQISSYFVSINSWLFMVYDWSPRFASFLENKIRSEGFTATIKYCADLSDMLIKNKSLPINKIGPYITLSNEVNAKILKNPRNCEGTLIGLEVPPTILQLLRFPKRYCPPHAPKIVSKGLNEFVAWDKEVASLWNREIPQGQLIEGVRLMYDNKDSIIWQSLYAASDFVFKNIDISDTDVLSFTSNSTVDGGNTTLQKLLAVLYDDNDFLYHRYSAPELFFNKKSRTRGIPVSVIGGVPKSYKACRVIAPELCSRQFRANTLSKLIDRQHKLSCINIHDQSRNQVLARRGSLDGSFGTIDCSHASDSISKVLAGELIPQRIWDVLVGRRFQGEYINSPRPDTRFKVTPFYSIDPRYGVLPHYFEYNEERHRLGALSTAGNSLTFILESLLFATIAIASILLVDKSDYPDKEKIFQSLVVYGDDIVIKSEYAATCMDLLSLCGIKANDDKSFIHQDLLYRESCGKEYFHGVDLSNVYLSRHPLSCVELFGCHPKPVDGRRDSYTGEVIDNFAMLVSLQHKLYDISPLSSSFLKELIMAVFPQACITPEGWGDTSIWDNFSVPRLCRESYDNKAKKISLSIASTVPRINEGAGPQIITKTMKPLLGLRGLRKLISLGWTESMLESIIEIFFYEQFLKNGPKFSDPFLELLGISDSPRSNKGTYLFRDELVWSDGGRIPVLEIEER